MRHPPPVPASAADIETLADHLSAVADELHARLLRDLGQRPPGGRGKKKANKPAQDGRRADSGAGDDTQDGGALPEAEAQALFNNEVALRQRADSLYLDAALLAASGLDGRQAQLLETAARAEETIRRIAYWKDMIDIAGELLQLSAAVASGQPEHIAAPLEKIKHHLDGLDPPA